LKNRPSGKLHFFFSRKSGLPFFFLLFISLFFSSKNGHFFGKKKKKRGESGQKKKKKEGFFCFSVKLGALFFLFFELLDWFFLFEKGFFIGKGVFLWGGQKN
jgi:hypothetical protein